MESSDKDNNTEDYGCPLRQSLSERRCRYAIILLSPVLHSELVGNIWRCVNLKFDK
jgi:hypothetical protein